MTSIKKKLFMPNDAVMIKGISDPRISPNGDKVAFVVTEKNLEESKQKSDIWVVSTGGEAPIKITDDGESTTPRWSHDSTTIAFYSSDEGKKELCLMKPDGAGRKVLTSFETSNAYLHRVGNILAWSPDGSVIAFIGTDKPKPDQEAIVVMERLMTKHLTGFMDFRRSHVFVIPSMGGKPEQLTYGNHDDHSICWRADGKEVIFLSDRSEQSDLFVRNDIWAVNVETKRERQITSTLGAAFKPICSPNGKYIAYLATTRADTSNDSVAEDLHLWVASIDGNSVKDLVEALDRPCNSFTWIPDGDRLLFTAMDRGRVNLYSVSTEDGKISTVMSGDWQIVLGGIKYRTGDINVSVDGKVVYLKIDITHPAQIYVADVDGSGETLLTDFNGYLEGFHIHEPKPFWFTTFDGLKVKGYIVKPIGYEPGRRYPTILYIHGGPHSMFGYGFNNSVQVFVNAGYAVVMIDPRGSCGYGQSFSDGCVLNWGGGDYKDLMGGLDYTIEHNDFIDPDRLGVIGGSYGGYMTNWIVTQTDRFKAAVSMASITNLLSFYGTSTVSSLIDQEFNGLPHNNMALLAQWSPITHVKNVRTPILLLHGEFDYTCPIGQAEEMYKAVKRLGVDTILVSYIGEGHGGIKNPKISIDRFQRTLDWFAKYLK